MPSENHSFEFEAVDDPRALAPLYFIASLALGDCKTDVALQKILDCVTGAFGATSGYIALLDPDTGRLEIEVQKNMPDGAREFALRPGQGVTGWVFAHAVPRLVPDTKAEPRHISIRPGARCVMAAPLGDGEGRVTGIINIDHDKRGAFNENDLAFFARLAREAAAVITRLWQLGQLRGKARQLESLIGIGRTLVAKVEQHELFAALARDTQAITQNYASALYLYQPARDSVTLAAFSSPGRRPGLPPSEIPLDSSLVASVIRTRRQLDFANIRGPDYLALDDIPRDTGLHSALASPMICEGELLGVLAVFTDRAHRFSNDEKRMLDVLASLGAVALQNARLYSRVFQGEALLRKNEQLTTLGLLAAEIAHEIRNPLTVIKLLYGYLGLDFPPDDPRRTDMRVIGEKLDQLEAIVSRVLNFAKAPSGLHSPRVLADIIDDTAVLIRLKLAQHKIRLHYEPPPRQLRVDVNKGQIQQVLLNLLLNSMQAMPDGGAITISTVVSENSIHVNVADNGPGLPEKVRGHIFDSFLSGRSDGTGLGLAIAKRIMLSHHGDIALLSTGKTGTAFRLTLPRVA
ncbi:GAF domain-containing protein [Ereboglobus luteus]|uniref:GAF domain-containing protein n=1 Tax=Ereboglobus luteus TaxID=1796921 RepID=UPI001F028319|nr:GAF domain-containing protein [Ereboglobus luteus]